MPAASRLTCGHRLHWMPASRIQTGLWKTFGHLVRETASLAPMIRLRVACRVSLPQPAVQVVAHSSEIGQTWTCASQDRTTAADGDPGSRAPQRSPAPHFLVTSGSATLRAVSMKSCAAALSVRFLRVITPIGPLASGSWIGNFLTNGCGSGNCSQNSGTMAR